MAGTAIELSLIRESMHDAWVGADALCPECGSPMQHQQYWNDDLMRQRLAMITLQADLNKGNVPTNQLQ